jgi:hypothetical protein
MWSLQFAKLVCWLPSPLGFTELVAFGCKVQHIYTTDISILQQLLYTRHHHSTTLEKIDEHVSKRTKKTSTKRDAVIMHGDFGCRLSNFGAYAQQQITRSEHPAANLFFAGTRPGMVYLQRRQIGQDY